MTGQGASNNGKYTATVTDFNKGGTTFTGSVAASGKLCPVGYFSSLLLSDANGFGSQPRNKETGVPAMLFEGFAKLRGQHGFFFPRLDPIAQDDQANSHDASPLVNRQSSTDRGQIDSGINGMSKTSVGPSANELVALFESDSSAPILSQVPAGPQSDSDAYPGEYDARNSKSVCSMENAMTKNADLRCVAEEQGKTNNFQKKDAVT